MALVLNHHGYRASTGRLSDNSGRSDTVETMVATDGTNLYFYVETDKDIPSHTGPDKLCGLGE